MRALDATSHVPITRPSHASLFTARYPAEHGVRDNISLPLAKEVPTLAETLSAQGFATAAFVSSFVLSSQSGLDRGFDYYDDAFDTGDGREMLSLGTVQRRGDETITRVERWLDGRAAEVKAKRTALWVHLYDPHDPYEPPEPFATRFADRPYDGEVAWTDTLLGRLRASLEARQLWNDALVIVTADHGEALGEHDETGHGFFAYETTLQIPLVMRGPGVAAGTTVAGTVRLVDLAPTALALLGLPALTGSTTGTNLAASLIAGGPPVPSAHDLRRVADSAHALPMERPAGAARGPVEVHPGAAARAVRPGQRPGRDPRSRRPRTPPPRAACAPHSRACCEPSASARWPPTPRRRRYRPRRCRSSARSATSVLAPPRARWPRAPIRRTRSASSGP